MSEKNMRLYNDFRNVPNEAKKSIQAGRLKGFTDINPMWRIKVFTEQFGPCGFGWYYTIDKQWLESGADGAVAAFVNISLHVKENDEWSAGIPGTGGSAFVAKESKGLYTDDEAFKKALTDAIGVAAKALGVGADVYFEKDASKYQGCEEQVSKNNTVPMERKKASSNKPSNRGEKMNEIMKVKGLTSDEMKTEVEKLLFKGVIKTMDVKGMTDIEFSAYITALEKNISGAA